MSDIQIKAFSIERTEIKTTTETFESARDAEGLGDEYDNWLSDMDRETLIIAPDGAVINPYGNAVDLLDMLKPILDEIPTWKVEQYVASRRSDEE